MKQRIHGATKRQTLTVAMRAVIDSETLVHCGCSSRFLSKEHWPQSYVPPHPLSPVVRYILWGWIVSRCDPTRKYLYFWCVGRFLHMNPARHTRRLTLSILRDSSPTYSTHTVPVPTARRSSENNREHFWARTARGLLTFIR